MTNFELIEADIRIKNLLFACVFWPEKVAEYIAKEEEKRDRKLREAYRWN